MKQKTFHHYIELYVQGNRERRFSKKQEEINAATKRNKDALRGLLTYYSDETKTALLGLMDNKDVWLALGAAKDYAYNFELSFEVKTKIMQVVKRCEACKTCTGVDKVSLMIFMNYVSRKKKDKR